MAIKCTPPILSSLNAEYIPSRLEKEGVRSPILLVLHGLGSEGAEFRDFRHIFPSHMSLLLLNAPDPYIQGYSWFTLENPAPGIHRSRTLLFSTLDEVRAQGWPLESIGVFGFSQGGLLALETAARYPQALGAILAISGFVFSIEEYPELFSSAFSQQKVFASGGRLDPVIPVDTTRKQVQKLCSLGMNIEWKEYEREHSIDPITEMDDIKKFLRLNLKEKPVSL